MLPISELSFTLLLSSTFLSSLNRVISFSTLKWLELQIGSHFLLLTLRRFLDIEVRHAILFAENLRRRLDKLHVVNHLRNFSVDYSQEQPRIVERHFLLLTQQVQDWRLITLEKPARSEIKDERE